MTHAKKIQNRISDLKSHLGYWLRSVSNGVSQGFAVRLQERGVTVAEWVVLRSMYDQQSMAPSLLAESMGMTRGAISKLVERLVAKGLASREGRDDDRRYQEIALTAEGRKLVPALSAIADGNDRQFFAPLNSDEQEALMASLKKLVQAHGLHKIPME
jgi:DNA-binding MarR family transcriptional regulator